jgi:hypothetical protein
MMGSPRLFLVTIALAAFAGGFMAGAALERRAGERALNAQAAERVAREGKTDRAFYARRPDQRDGGVSVHVER